MHTPNRLRTWFCLGGAACALTLVVACGDDDVEATDDDAGNDASVDATTPTADATTPGRDASDDAAIGADAGSDGAGDAGDAGDAGTCVSPLVIDPPDDAEARATTALQALASAATLTWAPLRGTFQNVSGLEIVLPGCTGDVDVYDQLFATLQASPDLFQIDPAEWRPDSVVTCSSITGSFNPLHIRRVKYGPYDFVDDVFSVVAEKRGDDVLLRSFSGFYLPAPTPAQVDALAACQELDAAGLAAAARATPFDYSTFAPAPAPMCTIEGDLTYTVQQGDQVIVAPNSQLISEETDHLSLRRRRDVTVVVAEANHTADLARSDANCPDDQGADNIGWIRTLDAVTGAPLFDHPTPDPFCQVCLTD